MPILRQELDLKLTERDGVNIVTAIGPCNASSFPLIRTAIELVLRSGKKIAFDLRLLRCESRSCSAQAEQLNSFLGAASAATIASDETEFACVRLLRALNPKGVVNGVDEAIARLKESENSEGS